MLDKRELQDELTDKFTQYQYRLEHPMPPAAETHITYLCAYLSDPVFRAKVDGLVAAVMHTVDKYTK